MLGAHIVFATVFAAFLVVKVVTMHSRYDNEMAESVKELFMIFTKRSPTVIGVGVGCTVTSSRHGDLHI